jgi:hypothetical protein
MKTYVHLHLAILFRMRHVSDTEAVRDNKPYILRSVNFFPKIVPFMR